MVRGLEIFREHFSRFADRYVLIGGTACDLAMGEAGMDFRATKDLDIVLCVEALDRAFVEAFWEFVRNGGYRAQEKAADKKQYYRFRKPTTSTYPFMLELFSRVPDALSLADDSHLTPIPTEEGISSLSAILLSDDYYRFLHAGRRVVDGLSFVGPEQLIPLKARAWLDLSDRRALGEAIDGKSIKKHRNDVFRLYRILDPDFEGKTPEIIKRDLREFISRQDKEKTDLRVLGLGSTDLGAILTDIRMTYGLGG